MKDIFKGEMPSKIYIQNGNISEKVPEKILKEKTPDAPFLDSLHYDNTPLEDSDGNELIYDNKKHDLNSLQYQHQKEGRKKTAINQKRTGLLGQFGESLHKNGGGSLWNIPISRKEIYFYDQRRHFRFG